MCTVYLTYRHTSTSAFEVDRLHSTVSTRFYFRVCTVERTNVRNMKKLRAANLDYGDLAYTPLALPPRKSSPYANATYREENSAAILRVILVRTSELLLANASYVYRVMRYNTRREKTWLLGACYDASPCMYVQTAHCRTATLRIT